MNFEKPGGAIHDVVRRAFDELRVHGNANGVVNIVTLALANSEGLPRLTSGRMYNRATPPTSPPVTGISSSGGPGPERGGAAGRSGPAGSGAKDSKFSMHWLAAGAAGLSAGAPLGNVSPSAVPPSNSVASGCSSSGVSGGGPGGGSTGGGSGGGNVEWLQKIYTFNRVQVLRLLLIRCEAYSLLRQHLNALNDALNAVEVSRGQSVEAFFALGRERRRLFDIPEAVAAFDTAEGLLRSMRHAVKLGDDVAVDGWMDETPSEEDFWARRGYDMESVKALGVSRADYELQERFGLCSTSFASESGPSSPLAGFGEGRIESGGTPLLRGTTRSTSFSAFSVTGDEARDDEVLSGGWDRDASELLQFGFTMNELSMWRRLAGESRALLTMRLSHTVPTTIYSATMVLLDRRISGTRGGLLLPIENHTSSALRLIGAYASDGQYHEGFSFPEVIQKGYCGIAMLAPRGWGGYSGCVCYEVQESLCCFFYFESPMLGSLKFGVQFVELRATDLRRAFVEHYTETGVQGIAGAWGSSGVAGSGASSNGIGSISAASVMTSQQGQHSRWELGSDRVSARSITAPLSAVVPNMNTARAAVKMPSSGMWLATHTVNLPPHRTLKATSRQAGNVVGSFSVSEVLPVRLRSIELIPALEYLGPNALKKFSATCRRYRELVNNLPPPMFYGVTRRPYPDYCVEADQHNSPWVVRDPQPVRWRLIFDGRLGEQDEFSISDESDAASRILCISSDAQVRVTGHIYYGDKHCLQYMIKESWIPFSSTVYLTTPCGRTFGNCSMQSSQNQFTLSLLCSGSGSGSGGNKGIDEALYTARKRVLPSGQVKTTGLLAPSYNSSGTLSTASAVPTMVTGAPNRQQGEQPPGTGLAVGEFTPSEPAVATVIPTTGTIAPAGETAVGRTPAVQPARNLAKKRSAVPLRGMEGSSGMAAVGVVGVGASGISSTFNNRGTTAPGGGGGQTEHYTIWRSQRVSGGALVNGRVNTTNSGADIVAELQINPSVGGVVVKGSVVAELKLFPGADAMLVSILAFLITRW